MNNDKPKVTRKKLSDYTPDLSNANQGSERGYRMIDDSITEDGVGRSGLVDKNGVVIAGNQTMSVLAANGIEDVIEVETTGKEWVVVKRTDTDLGDIDPNNTARRMAYRDNRSVDASLTWKPEQLQADKAAGVEIVDKLWSPVELGILGVENGEEPAPDPGADIDKAAELNKVWQVKRGDIWEIPSEDGKRVHKIMCGDSTSAEDVELLMGGVKAVYGIHDPPYGISVVSRSSAAIGGTKSFGTVGASGKVAANHYKPIIGDDKDFDPEHLFGLSKYTILWGANYYADKLPTMKGWIVWDKKGRADWKDNFSDCELAWTNMKIVTSIVYHIWMGMVQEGKREKRQHPTQKPSGMIVKIIDKYFKEDGIILDCYLGSGTTVIAAETSSRICYGLEIDPDYCSVILQRLSDLGLQPVRVEG